MLRNGLRPWLLLCCLLLLMPELACALTVEVRPGFAYEALGSGVEYLEDSDGSQTWETVQQRAGWQPFRGQELNFGFSSSAYWVRFHIVNTARVEQRLILQQRFPLIDSMDFYITRQGNLVAHRTAGDAQPAANRDLLQSSFLVPLVLPPADSATVLIKVKSGSGLQIPLILWDQAAYVENNHAWSLVYGVFYGLLLAMALYHLLIFYSVRELSFFYYALFNLSLLATYLCLHGVISAYVWPDFSYVSNRFINIAITSSVLFANLFLAEVLQVPQARPKLAAVLRLLAYVTVALMIASLALPYVAVVKGVLGLSGVAMLVLFSALLLRFIDGYGPAKIAFLSGSCASLGFAVSMLGNVGVIPVTPLTEVAGYVGIVVMSMVNAFALAYRMNMDREARQDAQAQLIENQRETNESLDRLVRERTDELENANALLHEISRTDALTQLSNRRHFDESLEIEFKRAFREKLPLSVLLMDIDNFKMINDRYGHPFGDLCLVKAADFIRASIRRPPDLAARYGGEEFIVLLPNTDVSGALNIATRILEKFNASVVEDEGVEACITVSIGVAALTPGAAESAASLLKKADTLLYQAKANGRNRIETGFDAEGEVVTGSGIGV
ncbi:MAG: hypothetical protein CL583_01375 [Alteromonadaceae bacterium]|nr:hypothetical protein [Alteromonadaceae bacterium]|tara:strand:- start:2600 stop:4444 length:1845 start_codon:yes stop_codon:yes gene_type:complete